jgi:tetratricopeptide (TPR) repeat protein
MKLASAFAVLILLATGNARAETDDPKAMFERARASFALGRYDEAAAAFEKSFAAKPVPELLYNAAQAHRLGGNKKRALQLYQSYVKLYGTEIANRGEVERIITTLKVAVETDERAQTAPPTATVTPATAAAPAPAIAAAHEPPAAAPVSAAPGRAALAPTATPAPGNALVAAPAPRHRPLVKKAWFWATIGGAVAVVGTGVALGIVFGSTTRNPSASHVVEAN